ncbi:tigger transposable element-derived protein 1-like [Alligator mississippiensis]|uniref:tigger transposable element-derived protein 1-like n=1 Tax=Alligator mississippiensis TaxID=8496 RepID=UPI0028779231|nr:tigger transposable element-derived protein 1-like [Alligator mississippiensis]
MRPASGTATCGFGNDVSQRASAFWTTTHTSEQETCSGGMGFTSSPKGMISTFKTYYLRRSIFQLLEDTDRPNKPKICEWWKAYNVSDAINNIKASWDEVKSTTINGA